MKVCVIANPVAGGGKGKPRAEALHAALRHRGHDVELLVTRGPGDAEVLAAERVGQGFDCFVSVGGDGTANEMVNGFGDALVPFTVMAVGTANVVARQFKIPKDPAGLAEVISRNRVLTMDLGETRGRKFLLGAGAGLDAAITTRVKAGRGKTSNYLIWIRPAIETILTYRYPEIRVTVDGKVLSETVHWAIVGNCVYSAGVFPSTPRALTDDGLLDVCLIHKITPLKCASLAVNVWRPGFCDREDIVYAQGREISFECAGAEAAPLQIDGDPAGECPISFKVLPGAARILAP